MKLVFSEPTRTLAGHPAAITLFYDGKNHWLGIGQGITTLALVPPLMVASLAVGSFVHSWAEAAKAAKLAAAKNAGKAVAK